MVNKNVKELYSSKIATTLVNPADASFILNGNAEIIKP
jgi:hypothetical protein